jgi:hypothetical protein
MKRIDIEFDEDGNCSIDGKDFHGVECEKFIKEVAKLLGVTIKESKKQDIRSINPNRQKECT